MADKAHVFVLDVLEELELAVSALREDGGVEGLHDLLDRDRGARQLVFCRAFRVMLGMTFVQR